MSRENVELLRQTVDAINRGDVDGSLENAADDFEMDWSNAIGPGRRGIYNGKDAARELWRSFVEALDELRWDFDVAVRARVDRTRARGGATPSRPPDAA